MCLQLFQLTCKCGHLHLRRKRKGEIEGGRKRREERSSHQHQHKAQALSSRNDLAPHDQTSTYLKSEKLPENKGPFLPQTHRKRNKKEKEKSFPLPFFQNRLSFTSEVIIYCIAGLSNEQVFVTTSAFHFYFLTPLHRPILYFFLKWWSL